MAMSSLKCVSWPGRRGLVAGDDRRRTAPPARRCRDARRRAVASGHQTSKRQSSCRREALRSACSRRRDDRAASAPGPRPESRSTSNRPTSRTHHPVAERLGEHFRRAGPPIVDREAKQIGLVAGLLLRPITDVLAVGRILRAAVVARIGRRDVSRPSRRAREREQPQIVVGRGGGLRIVVRDEAQLRAVGREVVLQRSAELERRRVEVAGRQVPTAPAGRASARKM